MTKREKLILKFKKSPSSLKFIEIRSILLDIWFEEIESKWSHKKYKIKNLKNDVVLPIHNNDCKDFYKDQLLKILINNNLI